MSSRFFLPVRSLWFDSPLAVQAEYEQRAKHAEDRRTAISRWLAKSDDEDQLTPSRVGVRSLRFSPS
jgi:hypothetical protein